MQEPVKIMRKILFYRLKSYRCGMLFRVHQSLYCRFTPCSNYSDISSALLENYVFAISSLLNRKGSVVLDG